MSTKTSAPTPSNFVVGMPVSTPTPAPTVSTLSTGAIVGITIGALVFVIVTASVILYLRQKALKNAKPAPPEGAPLIGNQRATRATQEELDAALGRGSASQTWTETRQPTVKATV
jgi:hypothetical protein